LFLYVLPLLVGKSFPSSVLNCVPPHNHNILLCPFYGENRLLHKWFPEISKHGFTAEVQTKIKSLHTLLIPLSKVLDVSFKEFWHSTPSYYANILGH
jgi:hypothetical protein